MVDCIDSWAGFETYIGWVRELTCGITQTVTGITADESVSKTDVAKTISVTKNSREVIGTATSFDDTYIGKQISIGGTWHEIMSVTDTTHITLRYPYAFESNTQTSYSIETSQYNIDESLGLSSTVHRFNRFGLITEFIPVHKTNMIRRRSVGSSEVSKEMHGAYETSVSLKYIPENFDRMRFVLGHDDEITWLKPCKVSVSDIDSTEVVTLSPPASKLYYGVSSFVEDYDLIILDVTNPLAKSVISTSNWSISSDGVTLTWAVTSNKDIEIYYVAEYDIKTITQSNHPESFSMVRALRRYENDYATDKDTRELFNGCKIDKWTMEINIEDMVVFTEEIISRYVRLSGEDTDDEESRRTFPIVSGIDSNSIFYSQYGSEIKVGDVPLGVDQLNDFYNFYDMNIQFIHEITEEVDTSTSTGHFFDDKSSGRRVLYLENLPFDGKNVDGKIDSSDLVLSINTGTGTIPAVCHVSENYVFFITGLPSGITKLNVTYRYLEDTYNFSNFSLQIARNLKQNRGIYDTIPVPYEIAENIFDVVGSFNANTHDYSIVKYYLDSTNFEIFLSFSTDYFMRLKNVTLNGALPESPIDDLYSISHEFVASDIEIWDWFDKSRHEYTAIPVQTHPFGTWASMSDAGLNERTYPASVCLNNKLYVIGGYDNTHASYSDENEVYDIASNNWSSKAVCMPFAGATAVTDGTNIFNLGGNGATSAYQTVRKYTVASNSWSTVGNMQSKRYYFGSAMVGNYIYNFCGRTLHSSPYTDVATVEVYNTGDNTSSWNNPNTGTAIPVYPGGATRGIACCAVGTDIYIIGGTANPIGCYKYDTLTNTWTSLAVIYLGLSHTFATAVYLNGLVYLIGGYGSGGVNDVRPETLRYDPATNSWDQDGDLIISRMGHAAGSNGTNIVVACGYSITGSMKNTEKYTTN